MSKAKTPTSAPVAAGAGSFDDQPPLIRQYLAIRRDLREDVMLFMRVGDFYEMFMEDAIQGAPIMGLALTRRAGVPMCGVPYYSIDAYLAKLVRAGKKVAVCDQVEPPPSRGAVTRREVTRIVTPGTYAGEEE